MPTPTEALDELRVLLVEDETLVAEEIKERLTRMGLHIVDIADTGEGAVEAATQYKPDLILMDIRLKGGMGGIQAADLIRRGLHIPVVFLTSYSDQETLRRAKRTEPFGYVLKPFHERDLMLAIEMALYRHGLERQLKENERRYAATLASIGDGVIATDLEGRITFMNPVAEILTQWRFQEARGLRIDEVFPIVIEATRIARENPVLQAIRLRGTVRLTEPSLLVTRNCEIIPIDDSAATITAENGEMYGAVVAFRDVRQRRFAEDALKRAEEQLRAAQKMEAIGRLAGGVAHDFNNLLCVINGYSELILQGRRLSKPSRQLFEEIKKAGERAAKLTHQLLAFSHLQVLQPTLVNLSNLIGDISSLLERLIGEDVLLTVTSAPDLWSIRADPSQIEQVIMNLAANARDAMPQGGRLTIETGNVEVDEAMIQTSPEMPLGRYVMLSVSDTGLGIDPETLEHIFEPFFTTKTRGRGTGLGLATVYGIVKQSGGFIYVYSEVRKGATFRLYFPALTARASMNSVTNHEGSGARRGTETILLVEDDDAVRLLIASALRGYGYTVHEAKNGQEALRLFGDYGTSIDMLVTDVVMPDMSGREVGEKVRAVKPAVRLLFLSGYADDAIVRHGVLRGQMNFLQKPFTLNALAQKVRNALDRGP
ncbi:MAG TPA: response regulator [Nitrospiraceae bacterium]|nr:response regulator [Nitrospiraceae bacterium]